MTQPTHILYLSGFGANYDSFRLRMIRKWRFANVTAELVPLRWEGNETFEQKVARVDQAIDRASGKKIVIIGESAGGSMAVHMYTRRSDDLYKVMGICGKNSHPETVGESYYQRSPAFRMSMERLNESIDSLSTEQKKRFVSIHAIYDPIVPTKETLLEGCKRLRLPSVGHFITIGLALTLFAPLVVRAAKSD